MRAPILIAAALACGAAALADPIVFDNSGGTFVWELYWPDFEQDGAYFLLDEPPTQDGGYDINGLRQYFDPGDLSPRFRELLITTRTFGKPDSTARVVQDSEPIILLDEDGAEIEFYFATVLLPGDSVGPGQNFATFGQLGAWNWSADPDSIHVIPQNSYVGVSILEDDGVHYGWVRLWLEYREDFPSVPDLFHPVAWGYETEPDTPIAIPSDCYADFTGDGALDLFDFLLFVNAFNAGDPAADCDDNGVHDLFDFLCYTNAFNEGC
jgi:hypothetical protein